jgi:AAA ATPase containing von Willebrand factor type A (vWA) domain
MTLKPLLFPHGHFQRVAVLCVILFFHKRTDFRIDHNFIPEKFQESDIITLIYTHTHIYIYIYGSIMLSHSGRSNLQIKLINDARKLLEKVKSQDAANLSLDSSFSSYDSDDKLTRKKEPLSPSKFNDIVIVKKSGPTSVSSASNQQDALIVMEKGESLVGNLNLSYSRSERGYEYVSDIDDSEEEDDDDKYCNGSTTKHDFKSSSRCSSNSTIPGLAVASCSSSRRSALDSQSMDDREEKDQEEVADDNDDHHYGHNDQDVCEDSNEEDNDDDAIEDDNDAKRTLMKGEGRDLDMEKADPKTELDCNDNDGIPDDQSNDSKDTISDISNTDNVLLLSSAKKLIATYNTKSSQSSVETQSSNRNTKNGKMEIIAADQTQAPEYSSLGLDENYVVKETKDDTVEDSTCRNVDRTTVQLSLSSTETCNSKDSLEDEKLQGTLSVMNIRNDAGESNEEKYNNASDYFDVSNAKDSSLPNTKKKVAPTVGSLVEHDGENVPKSSSSSVKIVRKTKRATLKFVDRSFDKDKSQIEALREENKRLQEDNKSLQEEMNLFDEKLACLELSLGLIESVEKAASGFNRHVGAIELNRSKSFSSRDSGACCPDEKSSKPSLVDIHHSSSIEQDGKNANDDKSFLSATSRQTSHSSSHSQGSGSYLSAESTTQTISTSKSKDCTKSNSMSRVNSKSSVTEPCNTKEEHKDTALSDEIIMLRDNNEKMLYAIKALSKAIMTQTRKHYHYKKKFGFTKKQVIDDNLKISQLSAEKDEVTSNFYKTRAQFLEEQDKREELSLSVQHLAKIMNDLRRKLKSEEEIKVKILDRIDEHSTSGASLPLSIATSGSQRMNSIKEIDATTRDSLDEILSPRSQKSFNISIGTNEGTTNTDNENSVGNLSMELEIIKLKSKLERRDTRIASLQRKLNAVKDYLKTVEEGKNKDVDV